MVWVEEDDGLRCYSSSPFTTRIKRRGGNISRKGKEISKKIKEGLRKKGKTVGRTLIDSCDKGIEKMDEFLAATPTKEHQVVVTNYKRAIVNRKAKMVEVVALVQENIGVGIKQEDKRRKNVLGSMAPSNFVKNPVVSASMGQGSSVKDLPRHVVKYCAYKAGLAFVKARLEVYKKNETVFIDNIKILKLDVMLRDKAITELRQKFEKAEKETDDLKLTLEKFQDSTKNLSRLLDSQQSDKSKNGLGYDS
nr:hypothetical protein [Tanacetum cinerariifolium]